MKCSKARKLIGDWLDGTIGQEDRERLEEHCQKCPDCRDLLEDFRMISEEAKGLAKFEPAGVLWPRILGGVRTAGTDRREKEMRLFGWERPRIAFAAALALLIVIGGAVVALKPWKSGPGPAPVGGEAYTLAKLKEAEHHYFLAIQALTEAVSSQRGEIDPQMASLFEKDLRIIDEAILACRNAIAENPQSLDARVYLLGAYKGKVEFLDNMIDVRKRTTARSAAEKTI